MPPSKVTMIAKEGSMVKTKLLAQSALKKERGGTRQR